MFKDALEKALNRTEGSLGALIMGTDGILVEKVMTQAGRDLNLDVAAATFASLIRSAQRTSDEIALGNLQELMIRLESTTLLMRQISREYFLILALSPDGNIGRGRFELRKAELDLAHEFAL